MRINLKLVLLCLLLINIVSCASVGTKDPTRQVHVTEAFIYPEYRQTVSVAEEFSRKQVAAASTSRAPASVP
ncbi:hypothetical protein AB1A81_05120 [Bdellovibrio bacteriovorus]|uniref:Uncharacterized protein n=1 Tax=Bdellovibrio bacteriovorus (strain ATCC 15356 / DSM 50701 / NCIMB 9529 / HD100) TaxID=264462 RepID=Q6MNW5_BDEBA|nr:hypothetical protein [Bdellovibrio bacteriovorus]CAE79036.1 hypothetical protein predicted by Glimmer/Critica [Bdellovibrio bacteriovorus HD100]